MCYENLKITKNAWDSNIINTNGKYLSVNWQASGGGAFAVIPLSEVGKAPDTVPLFRGHKAAVLDTAFNPFNENQVVSCSEDGKILLWDVPEDYSFHNYVDDDGNAKDILEPTKVLAGHTKKVGHVEFHPCAENVLASCSLDYSVKIWNLETGEAVITLPHSDLVTSFSFNYNGSLLATTSRDKKLRIWDIRSGKVISEGPGHNGAKPSRVVWLGNSDRICTTGFSRLSDRQIGIWDSNDIGKGPINGFIVIDSSSGVLIPIFDESNSILYVAGKGDGNIRYYEYDNDELYELSQYTSTDPQRGFACTPKIKVNVHENEILRSFKTVNDHSIEPISFIVPRKSELFQEDIYPDAPSDKPALSASEWFEGKEVNGPLLVNMESVFEGTTPEVRDSAPAVSVSEKKKASSVAPEAAKDSPVVDSPSQSTSKFDSQKFDSSNSSSKNEVDEVLKGSQKVDDLLNKVVDESEDEDAQRIQESKDDGWEEVEIPKTTASSAEAEAESKEEPKEKPKEEPKEETKEEPKDEVHEATKDSESKEAHKEEVPKEEAPKKEAPKEELKDSSGEEPKVGLKVESKTEPKLEAKIEAKASASAGQPTLRATVDKLAKLVESLESHIATLVEANIEKNEKIELLERKVEQLLKK